ncbi:MAG TPA: 16S rRNA (adenine(1518)-N(6)/adenine(1519)-N(6))-dimethyltransferase RsmA [Acidimicrobiales bacterium]|nr:16S rRNA (adenine(1518)-N(6)/adenine(1519)-N(6))-dimethyltransferase RsmA [Acidimicrobiales bacterium]
MTLSRHDVQEMIAANDLRPSRALGQNFVVDPNTVRRVARLAELEDGQRVVEIGAGIGALTLALVDAGAKVTAVEIDRHLLPILRAQVEDSGVRVVHDDALTLDWTALLHGDVATAGTESDRPWALVANLPYNVAVPVIVRALDEAPDVASMLVMVQREVGERLAAGPGTKAYGAVSVKVAYHADARVVGRVPPAVFVPRPRVESVLVRIVRRPAVAVDPVVVSPDRLFTVVRAGFAHRRKMLRRSLAGVVDAGAFTAAAVSPEARAEELSVEDWGRLVACAQEGDNRW